MKLLEMLRQLTADDQEIYALLNEGFDGSQSIGRSGSQELVFHAREYPDDAYVTLRFKGNRITGVIPGKRLTKTVQDDLVEKATQALQKDAGTHVVSRYIFAKRPLKGQFQVNDDLRLRPPPPDSIIGSGLDERHKATDHFDKKRIDI